MELNYIVAPIMQQRGLQLAHLECTFDLETSSTVYTATSACGKIGTFSIPATIFCDAHQQNTVDELLAYHFGKMEFFDGQSTVPEVQPESADSETGSGQSEPNQETVNVISTARQSQTDAGSPPAEAEPAREE